MRSAGEGCGLSGIVEVPYMTDFEGWRFKVVSSSVHEKSRIPKEAAFCKMGRPGRLTLGELEALAGAGLAGLLALSGTRVTAEKAFGFQGGTEFGVVKNQGAGNRKLDGVGLAVHATSTGDRFDVKLVLQVRDLEWFEKLAL